MSKTERDETLLLHGVTLHGDPGRKVLLYAHGFGCNQAMWNAVIPAFADSHHQILFDHAGQGVYPSARFDARSHGSLQGYAEDLIAICDALGLTQGVTLVAHSVSCSIGMLASLARPDLFEGMVMIGPSPCYLNDPPAYQGGFERADLDGLIDLMGQNFIGWAHHLAPIAAGPAGAGQTEDALIGSFCSTDPETALVFARATFFADNRKEIEQLRVPTLILQHADDVLAPASVGAYMVDRLPDADLVTLDVSGHCAHMSNPDLVIRAMKASRLSAFADGADHSVAA